MTDRQIVRSALNSLADRVAAQIRMAPGGKRISPYEIAWDGGRVIMSFPLTGQRQAPPSSPTALRMLRGNAPGDSPLGAASPASIHGCPTQIIGNDYYCFYQDSNWGGRRLQFKDSRQTINFSDFGFAYETSSWVNGGGLHVYVDGFIGGIGQFYQLWHEYPHSESSWVGSDNNDQAYRFRA